MEGALEKLVYVLSILSLSTKDQLCAVWGKIVEQREIIGFFEMEKWYKAETQGEGLVIGSDQDNYEMICDKMRDKTHQSQRKQDPHRGK